MSDAIRGPVRVVIGAGALDQRDFVLPYRIQIENGTDRVARGVIVHHLLGQTPDEAPLEVYVRAGGVSEVELRISLDAQPQRLAVLLRADRLSYNAEVIVPALETAAPPSRPALEAARPALRGSGTTLRIARATPPVAAAAAPPARLVPIPLVVFGIVAGVGIGATLLAGVAILPPQIIELAAPSPVIPGGRIEVPYRFSGVGRARYRVADAGGTLDAGTLAERDGALRLQVPPVIRGRSLAISLEIAGPFGSARRTARTEVLVPPAPRNVAVAPHISLVALDRATVRPGDDVHLTYRVEPPSGEAAIVDSFGDTVAAVPLGPAGHATLRVPARPGSHELAVVVRAGSGAASAESRIPLELAPDPALAAAGGDAGGTTGNPGLSVPDPRVSSGDQIRVRIDTAYDSLRLELFDAAHHSVAAVALGPGLREAALIAPRVAATTPYTLEATDIQGNAQSTSIFPLTVTPASVQTP